MTDSDLKALRRTRAALMREIRADWPKIQRRSRCHPSPPPGQGSRIFSDSVKVRKGRAAGIATAVAYLAPATEAGREVCAGRSHGCTVDCLGHSSGLMITRTSQRARLWRTVLYFGDRARWEALARAEIAGHILSAKREGFRPAVRVDGSSDTGAGIRLAADFLECDVAFYDYTKILPRVISFARGMLPANYHLTFSRSGENDRECAQALAAGVNVAAVFTEVLPAQWQGREVLNGDAHDARFLDPAGGRWVGLRYKRSKGRAAAVDAAVAHGFAIDAEARAAA